MGSYQIWPCHVTQAENLSFPYLKSYCPLNVRKSHQISWFCCIPDGSYKEDNLKEGRICPPPIWNRVKYVKEEIINGPMIIINKSIKEGAVPYLLKIAKVIPIHKKDDVS